MPSPERGEGPRHPEHPPQPEQEPAPYYRAARFPGERPAGRAYVAAQDALFQYPEPVDLSTYRFQLNRVYHVAVLGQPPPDELDRTLAAILAAGEPVELPAEVLKLLSERRTQATRHGEWVERHYRPENPL